MVEASEAGRTSACRHETNGLAPLFAYERPAGTVTERRAAARVRAALLGGRVAAPRLDRYQLKRVIGAGGMGEVWLADDPALARAVAIKLVHTGRGAGAREQAERLTREARAMAKLSHPNVVQVFDVGTYASGDDGVANDVFIVMEFVDGPTLAASLSAGARRWREILALFDQAGAGLAAAHDAGLVHRDFKPSNVLMGRDGRVRVGDFGLAHRGLARPRDGVTIAREELAHELVETLDGSLTASGAVIGTPLYMAPEQHRGEPADARSDQYAFCVALYEALARTRPFAGSLETLLRAKLTRAPAAPRADAVFPEAVRDIVLRGLAPDPAKRWPSMRALLAALDRVTRSRWATHGIALALACVGAWSLWPQTTPENCPGRAQLLEAWTPPRRHAIEAMLLERISPTSTARAIAALDRQAQLLEDALGQACAGAALDGACLRDATTQFATTVEVLERTNPSTVGEAIAATTLLPEPSRCTNADPATASSAGTEEALARVRALARAGVRDEAIAAAHDAIERARVLGEDGQPGTARLRYELGSIHEDRGEFVAAQDAFDDSYLVASEHGDDALAAMSAVRLALLDAEAGADEDAKWWRRHAEAAFGRSAPDGCEEINYRQLDASVGASLGDVDDAIVGFRAVLELCDASTCPTSCSTVESNTAQVLTLTGRFDEALALQAVAIDRLVELHGADGFLVAKARVARAETLYRAGATAQALDEIRATTAEFERLAGPRHPQLAQLARLESSALAKTGDALGALAAARRAVELDEPNSTRDDPSHASYRGALANALADAGERHAAIAEYDRLLEEFPYHFVSIPLHLSRGYTRMELGDLAGALADAREARILAGAIAPYAQPLIGNSYLNEATALRQVGRCTDANEVLAAGIRWAQRDDAPAVLDDLHAERQIPCSDAVR